VRAYASGINAGLADCNGQRLGGSRLDFSAVNPSLSLMFGDGNPDMPPTYRFNQHRSHGLGIGLDLVFWNWMRRFSIPDLYVPAGANSNNGSISSDPRESEVFANDNSTDLKRCVLWALLPVPAHRISRTE
jgi:hypothetical protein